MVGRSKRYALADTAQQIVGGFLLAGPFVVTEEVWVLANNMRWYHVALTLTLVATIGYAALYRADDDRDPDRESEVAGIPVRFVSLMGVSYGAVLILAVAFRAPQTFAANIELGVGTVGLVLFTLKATSVGAVFSVVGAATADSLL